MVEREILGLESNEEQKERWVFWESAEEENIRLLWIAENRRWI